jgi:outer membrane protein TolC
MKGTILFISIFFLILPAALRAEEILLTADETVALSLRENRDVLLKAEDIKKAKAKLAEANAGLFPSLTASFTWQDVRELYQKDLPEKNSHISLKQYFYQGGRVIDTIRYSQQGIEIAKALLDKTKIETVLNVRRAFYTLLLAADFSRLNREILENTKEHLAYLEERYKNGEASESDILQIKQSLATIEDAYETSLNQVDSSEALLKNLLFLDEKVKIRPQARFEYSPEEVAYDEGLLKAMKSRPEIRQFEAQEKQSKYAIEMAKAEGRPSIYASWDYYSSSTTILTFAPSRAWQDYNVIGMTVSWPIFDGWATRAKVEQAIVDLKETQLLKEKTVKDIATELKEAYLGLKDAISSIQASEADILLYQDNLSVVTQKGQAGIASYLDLDDAHLKYNVSKFNQQQAIYDYIVAKAGFEKATGGL